VGYHALLGPSGASRWSSCTASPSQCEGKPSKSSEASRPGTALHQAGGECLEDEIDPSAFLGRVMGFPRSGDEGWLDELPRASLNDLEFTHRIDEADVEHIRTYVDYVRALTKELNGTLIVETDVPIEHITKERDATGRSDALILAPPLIVCIDAKFGKKKVRAYDVVQPEQIDPLTGEITPEQRRMNLQLAMYVSGALDRFGGNRGAYKQARAVIVQPLIKWVHQYDTTVAEVQRVCGWLSQQADLTRTKPEFVATFENCLFCSGKDDCPARGEVLRSKAEEGFEEVPESQTVESIDLF
jgi:hypothetical protein